MSETSVVSDGLLAAAKNYLDMTWADDAADKKLCGILARGIAYLDHLAGVAQNYDIEGNAKALLLDYARYVRAGSLQDFAADFSSELLGLHTAWEVAQYDAAAE